MKFRTTCPHCDSVLRLTAEQLDAARGWAQCGVCGVAFDMRRALAAENGDPLPAEVEPSELAPSTQVAPLTEAAIESLPGRATHAEITGDHLQPVEAPPDPTDPAALGFSTVTQLAGIENRASPPDLTSIILIDPDAEVTDDYGPLPNFSTQDAGESASPDASSVYGPSYIATSAAAPKSGRRVFAADVRTAPPKTVTTGSRPRGRASYGLWILASLVLVFLLALQLAYFLRDTLVSQIPAARPWVEAGCAQLGCTLSLPKDAALIQIIGSDLQAEPAGPGHLKLKLTLGNRAQYAQAWPLLVLTLTDQKDQPQARRSFAPSEYLADLKLIAAGIPAQSEHLLSLPLEVRNLTLAGYRLEVAY